MRRILCLLLALCLLCPALAGCGEAPLPEETRTEPRPEELCRNVLPEVPGVKAAPAEIRQPPETIKVSQVRTGETVLQDVSFVLVYDPLIYNENSRQQIEMTTLYSGDMSRQIITGLNRAGEQDPLIPELPRMISQAEINRDLDLGDEKPMPGRAVGDDPVYELGSTHGFFCKDASMSLRVKRDFTCVYVGETCYIWSVDQSVGEEEAAMVAREFDEKIFPQDVEYFGTPRFTENGGKVNVLFYPLPEGLCGFFTRYDLFSSSEYPKSLAERMTLNTDHAIITINSEMLKTDLPEVYATLAHELQHLICATEARYYADSPFVQTWLDEAMSACAEERCYPGIKNEGCYNLLLYFSDNFRKGQSLYNFDNETDVYIGAYGVVYLFEKYLCQHAGDDVFSKIHNCWRESYRADITEAEAICTSVPPEFLEELDEKYTFPPSISERFSSREEEWMSKMTLDFYLETLSPELAELMDWTDIAHRFMLYSEVNPLDIQGGGRVIVATENGSFTIPDDAGKGLIFVGLDKDFNVVTELYSNAK